MSTIRYEWDDGEADRVFELVHIDGTNGSPYRFGEGDAVRSIEVQSFWIATVPVTQALSVHAMGDEWGSSDQRMPGRRPAVFTS